MSAPGTYASKTAMPFAHMIMLTGLVLDGQVNLEKMEEDFHAFHLIWPLLSGRLLMAPNWGPRHYTTGGSHVDFKSRNALATPLVEALGTPIRPTDVFTHISERSFTWFYFDEPPFYNGQLTETLLTLRVTVLADATLLGFRMPHYFVDGADMFKTIAAFSAVCAGRHIPILTLPPAAETPLSTLVTTPALTPWARAPIADLHKLLTDGQPLEPPNRRFTCLPRLSLRFPITWRPHYLGPPSKRIVRLSVADITSLRAEAQASFPPNNSEPYPILSRADIVAAWFIVRSFEHYKPSKRPVAVHYAFNYRQHQPAPPAGTTTLHNSNYPLLIRWPTLADLQQRTVAQVAMAIRTSVLLARGGVKETLEFWEERQSKWWMRPAPRELTKGAYMAAVTMATEMSYDTLQWDGAGVIGVDISAVGAPDICPYAFVMMKEDKYILCARNVAKGWRGLEEALADGAQFK